MEKPILNDPEVEPIETVLEAALGAAYPLYTRFMDTIGAEPFGLAPNWRFYKDGGAWLCKVTRGKKTMHWLAIWPGLFKITFYFTEKNGSGIPDLPVDEALKRQYAENKPIGQLKPLTVEMRSEAGLEDALELITYRMAH